MQHRYGGVTLDVVIADPLGEGWYDHDWPRISELDFLRRGRLKRGARVFDVGAHHCIYALVLADIVGREGLVVAVEAEPHNVEVAAENLRLNDAANVALVHAAASDRDGSLSFAVGLDGRVDDATRFGNISVPARTIDSLAEEFGMPDVVYIDVEGFEVQVLRGATNVLATGRPDVCVEVHVGLGLEHFGGDVASLLDVFSARGYRLYVGEDDATADGFVELGDTDPAEQIPRGRFFLVAMSDRGPDR